MKTVLQVVGLIIAAALVLAGASLLLVAWATGVVVVVGALVHRFTGTWLFGSPESLLSHATAIGAWFMLGSVVLGLGVVGVLERRNPGSVLDPDGAPQPQCGDEVPS